MKELYYTPNLEDLHVGFECEIDYIGMCGKPEQYIPFKLEDYQLKELLDQYN